MTNWGPLVARARGLSGRLLAPATLHALALSTDGRAFSNALARMAYLAFPSNAPPPDDRAVEAAIRRVIARHMAVLSRWSRDNDDLLVPLLEDEDRRSIRALVRGAMAGVPPDVRTAGLVPTPALPARVLDELALLGDISSIAAVLLALGHPFAGALAAEAHLDRPDLFSIEQAVMRAWAAGALGAARRGDAALRLYVQRMIDVHNLCAARLLAEQRSDATAHALFVSGGALVHLEDLQHAAELRRPESLARRMQARVAHTPLHAALLAPTRAADDAALMALLAEFAGRSRREPLGMGPVICYVLRSRAEQRALLRILWQISLGVPADRRVRDLEESA
ncbi:MAG: V0D/AC39 family V-type ATPase subunit [Gemmatimonadaceae bacterium]